MASDLEERFERVMMDLCRRMKAEADYPAVGYFQVLTEHRGIETARLLLNADAVSDGYTVLWERGRLDLTVEALIHDNPEFYPLFTSGELDTARRRLVAYRYPPALDPVEQFIGAFPSGILDWADAHDRYLGAGGEHVTDPKGKAG